MKKKLEDFIGFIICVGIIFGIVFALAHFMKSVSATLLSIFVISFLFAITSLDEVKQDCEK